MGKEKCSINLLFLYSSFFVFLINYCRQGPTVFSKKKKTYQGLLYCSIGHSTPLHTPIVALHSHHVGLAVSHMILMGDNLYVLIPIVIN